MIHTVIGYTLGGAALAVGTLVLAYLTVCFCCRVVESLLSRILKFLKIWGMVALFVRHRKQFKKWLAENGCATGDTEHTEETDD